ncbi:MAG: alpha/beta hydrolase [Cytophagaceae bacterium]|nr:alpha/beta hydrolase [Cytophagaceae bacterium]
MIAYCISGLGADERVFTALQLKYETVPIHWLTPLSYESLEEYCHRLIEQIDTSAAFILIGVSFGGMIACELNRYITPEQTIIISSAAQASELPVLYKVMGKIKLASWLPEFILFPPLFVLNYLFGVKTAAHKTLLKNISEDTDPVFARWAIDKITHWENNFIPDNLIRIHGDKDKVLSYYTPETYLIKGGEHFMIVERAEEISAIINSL